jgi:hypothetical protein
MSLTKLPLGRNNPVLTSLFPPRESLVVTSRLGTGNSRTFFYGVWKRKMKWKYVFLAYKIIQFNFPKILLLLLSLLQSVSVHDPSSAVCVLSLLQSVPVHDPSSAVCAYYPYCSLCMYMILLLLYVHIIPIAVCVCT